MTEIRTVTTLRSKRKEIAASIQLYERQIAQARADLAHVEAAILIFEASGSRKAMTSYHDTHRLFGRREKIEMVKAAIAKHGPMDTRELAIVCMKAKGLDPKDKVMAKSVAHTLVHALRMQAQRGAMVMQGKRRGVSVWALPEKNGTAG